MGSLSELETQVIIANRLGYLADPSNLLESIEVGYTKVNRRSDIFSKKEREVMGDE